MFELRLPLAVLLGNFLFTFSLSGGRLRLKLILSLLWTSLLCLFILRGLGMDPDFALLLFLSGFLLSLAQFFVGAMANRSVSLNILRELARGQSMEQVEAEYLIQIRSRLDEAKNLGLLAEDGQQGLRLSPLGWLASVFLSIWSLLFDSAFPRVWKLFISLFPRLLVWATYIGSVAYRYYFTFVIASPERHIASDAYGYYVRARNVCEHAYPWGIGDLLFPPGTDYFYGSIYCLRGEILDISWGIVVLSSLIPLLIFSIAAQLFPRRIAYLSFFLGSIYFPFINFGGFYLSEIPMMATLFAATSGMVRVLKSEKSIPRLIPLCFLTGLLYAAAGSVKIQSLAPLLMTAVLYPLFLRSKRLRVLLLLVFVGIGTLPVLIPCAVRCTRLNEGHFCFIGKTFGLNFLVGHQLKNPTLRFTDARRGLHYLVMGPAMGYYKNAEIPELHFGPYDDDLVRAEALRMFREHPREMAFTFFRNSLAYFGAVHSWPTAEVPYVVYKIFRNFVWFMFGTLYLQLLLRGPRRKLAEIDSAYWQLIIPMFGGYICGILASGEPRYRVPFDAFLIILFAAAIFEIPRRIKELRSGQ